MDPMHSIEKRVFGEPLATMRAIQRMTPKKKEDEEDLDNQADYEPPEDVNTLRKEYYGIRGWFQRRKAK